MAVVDREEWLRIENFPNYEVSSAGRVRRARPRPRGGVGVGYLMHLKPSEKGYLSVHLADGTGRYKAVKVHRLVVEAFIGPFENGIETHHINGNKQDNRVENLLQVTSEENRRQSVYLGLTARGRRNGSVKLVASEVAEIDRLLRGGMMPTEIGRRFGVAEGTVRAIRRGQTWGWLTTREREDDAR